jgi:hypothetical protein
MIELLHEKNWKRMENFSTFRSEIASKIIRFLRHGGAEVLQWLMDYGVELNKRDNRESALMGVDEDLILILISADAEAATRFRLVYTAIRYCNPGVVKQLLNTGASLNGGGGGVYDEREGPMDTPLIEAIYLSKTGDLHSPANVRGRLAMARSLLEYGADFNVRGLYGRTAVEIVD